MLLGLREQPVKISKTARVTIRYLNIKICSPYPLDDTKMIPKNALILVTEIKMVSCIMTSYIEKV